MTEETRFRSAVAGLADSLRKHFPSARALALESVILSLALLITFVAHQLRQVHEIATETAEITGFSACPLAPAGSSRGQSPLEDYLSASKSAPEEVLAAYSRTVSKSWEPVYPEGIIAEWYGGEPMDLAALRRTIEYVTRQLRPDGSWGSANVQYLMLETAAVETALGEIVRQKNGPALSVWQILGFNFEEIPEYFAKRDPELLKRAMAFYNRNRSAEWNRVHNIPWTAAMSLLYYEKATRGNFLVRLDSLDSRGRLWKNIYNTRLGKGTVKRYKQRAMEYVHMALKDS